MDTRKPFNTPNCPNCGALYGAKMNNTSWGHDVSCCSDRCGLAVAKRLAKNMRQHQYLNSLKKVSKIQRELRKAKTELLAAKYTGINGIGFSDSLED